MFLQSAKSSSVFYSHFVKSFNFHLLPDLGQFKTKLYEMGE